LFGFVSTLASDNSCLTQVQAMCHFCHVHQCRNSDVLLPRTCVHVAGNQGSEGRGHTDYSR